MRRRDLGELTGREREVLELLRRDFTNEQIAQRLGISLDGAKYHVSQILSKLGVASREDAAAVALGERRRWWARWPLWAKVAGAATTAAAMAGLAALAWGVVRMEGDEEEASAACPPGTEIPDVLSTLRVTITSYSGDQLTAIRSDLGAPENIRLNLRCYTTILRDSQHIDAEDVRTGEFADVLVAASSDESPYDAVTLYIGSSRLSTGPAVAGLTDVGPEEQFQVGEPTHFEDSEGHGFWVVRLPGEFVALSDIDTHSVFSTKECVIGWRTDVSALGRDGWFRGTCSGSNFDLDGRRVWGPSPASMYRYSIDVTGGRVVVDTSAPSCSPFDASTGFCNLGQVSR